jgi:multiple sugar transport system substrate-binding protein
MKKISALVLAATIIATTAFAGCSKKENTQTPSKSDDANAPVKLSFTWWGSQSRHDYTQKLLEEYTKLHPNVTFESTPAGWDGYMDKISAMAAGNTLPDIIQMDYSFISTFTKNNTLADLTSYVDKKTLDLSDVDQNLVSTGKINGKLTGAVVSNASLAVAYNPDVFKKAGLDVPKTGWNWSEFEKNMLAIKEKTGSYGVDKIEVQNYFPLWVRQYGKNLYAQDGTKLGYDDDKIFVDYVSMLSRLQNAKALPNPDEWAQISAKGKEAQPVVTGGSGVTFEWSNYAVIVSKANPNLKLTTPPVSDNGTKGLYIKPGMFLSVSNKSKNQEEAAKFISWFINDIDANKTINAERGVPVASKVRAALKPTLSVQNQEMFDYIDLATKNSTKADAPDPAGATEVIKIMTDSINKVLYGKSTADAAAKEFREKANAVLARNSAK